LFVAEVLPGESQQKATDQNERRPKGKVGRFFPRPSPGVVCGKGGFHFFAQWLRALRPDTVTFAVPIYHHTIFKRDLQTPAWVADIARNTYDPKSSVLNLLNKLPGASME